MDSAGDTERCGAGRGTDFIWLFDSDLNSNPGWLSGGSARYNDPGNLAHIRLNRVHLKDRGWQTETGQEGHTRREWVQQWEVKTKQMADQRLDRREILQYTVGCCGGWVVKEHVPYGLWPSWSPVWLPTGTIILCVVCPPILSPYFLSHHHCPDEKRQPPPLDNFVGQCVWATTQRQTVSLNHSLFWF